MKRKKIGHYLDHFRSFSAILGSLWPFFGHVFLVKFSAILGQLIWCWYSLPHLDHLPKHFRPFWAIVAHFRVILTIFGNDFAIFRHFRSGNLVPKHFRPFWAILGNFWPFWVIFGHFRVILAIFGHLGGICVWVVWLILVWLQRSASIPLF